jgi:hypothetical protein
MNVDGLTREHVASHLQVSFGISATLFTHVIVVLFLEITTNENRIESFFFVLACLKLI